DPRGRWRRKARRVDRLVAPLRARPGVAPGLLFRGVLGGVQPGLGAAARHARRRLEVRGPADTRALRREDRSGWGFEPRLVAGGAAPRAGPDASPRVGLRRDAPGRSRAGGGAKTAEPRLSLRLRRREEDLRPGGRSQEPRRGRR